MRNWGFIVIVTTLIFLAYSVKAQTNFNPRFYNRSERETKKKNSAAYWDRLYKGDTLPEFNITFTDIKNYPKEILSWTDLKNKKLIILDFWSKGCTSCVAGFPKMEELQNRFKDDIQIILITPNSKVEIEEYFKTLNNIKHSNLPMVFSDSLFNFSLFPHNTVPYHVWISSNNEVIATVYPDETNEGNIQTYLDGKHPIMAIRNDQTTYLIPPELKNPTTSLLKFERGRLINNLIFYSRLPPEIIPNQITEDKSKIPVIELPKFSEYSAFFTADKGYIGNIRRGLYKDKTGTTIGSKYYNCHIDQLLHDAYLDTIVKLNKTNYYRKNYIFYVDTSANKFFETINDSTYMHRMQINKSYSYESCMKDFSPQKSRRLLQEDIARCLGIRVKTGIRKHRLLTLSIIDSTKLLALTPKDSNSRDSVTTYTNEQIEIRNENWSSMLANVWEKNRDIEGLIIEDQTGLPQKFKIYLSFPINSFKLTKDNVKKIQSTLTKYGIQLSDQIKEGEFLIIYSNFH